MIRNGQMPGLIHKGSLSYLEELMKAGVKIYLYKKGFLHSKLMVCDDELSTIGSTNMDFRSFEHNLKPMPSSIIGRRHWL